MDDQGVKHLIEDFRTNHPDLAKSLDDFGKRLQEICPRDPNVKTIVCPKCLGNECAYCYGCGVIDVHKDYEPPRIILP